MRDSAEELIRASGLFDPEHYCRIYGHWITGDPLRHFLEAGLALGYLPSPDFDPVLYRVLVPECGDANPLLHCLASGARFRPPPLRRLFPISPTGPSKAHVKLEYVAAARELPFSVEGTRYVLKIPEPAAFLDRLRADRPFACARLPHGFWDAVWRRDVMEAAIAADERASKLCPAQRRALALRLCASIRAGHGAFAPSFIDEVLADIPVHAANPDFLRAVSLTGFPTYDGDVVGNRAAGPPRDAILRSFAMHFGSAEALYDATLWKRLLFTGYLGALPKLCRDRAVVLVASDLFASLDTRWQLEDFTHVEIPRMLTQWQRWDLLTRTSHAVAAASARSGRPPVVLTQCGGSLAYWLITRLFADHPRVFYLDLGQALNGWFFDVAEIGSSTWVSLYGHSTIHSNDLESYYRARLGASYDVWLAALSSPAKSEDEIPRQLIEGIKTRQPGLFEGDMTVQTASALLLEAFEVVREQLHNAPEGRLQVKGLGTFRIRNIQQGKAEANVARKVINFAVGPATEQH